ncbi:MAG: hypothetical protein MJE66_14110 [Proteobacteria bacterium]|nr:hypothetical protein [Pseudomonadota bacterium]
MRIGILNNLRAGRSDAQVSRLLALLRRHPEVAHVETDSAEAVPEALSELARQEVELLIVNGGDGTVQHALTEILGSREFGDRVPWIAPLRGGRTNMSALDLGASRDPVRGVAGLLEDAKTGRLHDRLCPRHVLRVQSPRDELDTYGMFFGAGVIYRAIELVHRLFPKGRSQGVFGSTVVTGALVAKLAMRRTDGVLTPNKVQMLLDGEPARDGEYQLIISSTLGRLFAKMRPFWGREPAPLQFTSIACGADRFGRCASGILRGRPGAGVTQENGYTSRNLHRLELRLDCGFTVDGELYAPESGRTVRITADDRVDFVRA